MKILYKQITVIVGTGDQFIRLPPDLMAEFKRREVAIEVSNTYHASALYNLMCTEREGNGVVLFCKVMVKKKKNTKWHFSDVRASEAPK